MSEYASDIAFTQAVKAIQTKKGSRAGYEKVEQNGWKTQVSPYLTSFLEKLDMFYLGTSNAAGQPYIQYRGGKPGFLKVLDHKTLGFADFSGNRQYITLGNLSENPKAFIFLIDYATQTRVKLWGTAKVIEDDFALTSKLTDMSYPGLAERAITFQIEAWDINCPQHIHKRFSHQEVAPIVAELKARVKELEAELAKQS